ncbi:MAG: 23S rRNA (adenine(2503)-C(2))-methyltransferase RlmN [Desulfobulbus propionicus]|nr:MAG: 23S rRNA (adenine(2503)-C(2))-methyltransferase RlmN [Desulfobulbus propionicus]
MNQPKRDLKNLTQDQLVDFVRSLGQPDFRARQLLAWIYRPGKIGFDEMTDLAKVFREVLQKYACISRFESFQVERSRDGSAKFAFRLDDAELIESVLIPEEDRSTLCLSTQVGCAMGCSFCCTGSMGFTRNLCTAEIINQVCAVRDWLIAQGLPPLTNLVFMGMGEPLANITPLLSAISLLTEQRGLDFSARRITVSTCGLIPQMLELGRKTQVNLAVSLHATNDEVRSQLMPVNRRYPLEALLQACHDFPRKKRQRIMIEYTLFDGINDNDGDALALAKLLHGLPCKINLLSVNATDKEAFKSPDRARVLTFQKILRDKGHTVFIRQSRGADISAACGQLAARSKKPRQALCVTK